MQTNSTLLTDLGTRASQYLGPLLQNPKTNARLSLATTLVLLLLATYSAAALTWRFLEPEQTAITPTFSAASNNNAANPEVDLASVAKLHLFGKADRSKPVSNAPIIAPETRLQLILRGTFASDDQNESMAIIAEKGSKDKTYFKNDSLPGNASLHEIYADRVILSRNGKLETLRLITEKADIGAQKQTPRSNNRPGPAKRSQSGNSRMAQMRKQLKNDRTQLLKSIRITPVKKDDRIQGYHFRHRDPALMREIGILPQDVITSINGQPVSNMGSMMEIMRQVDSLQELNLSILRHGTPRSLTVKLN